MLYWEQRAAVSRLAGSPLAPFANFAVTWTRHLTRLNKGRHRRMSTLRGV